LKSPELAGAGSQASATVYAVIAVTRKFVAVGGLPRADLPAKAVLEARTIMSPKIMTGGASRERRNQQCGSGVFSDFFKPAHKVIFFLRFD
jgi:hypothetical protein